MSHGTRAQLEDWTWVGTPGSSWRWLTARCAYPAPGLPHRCTGPRKGFLLPGITSDAVLRRAICPQALVLSPTGSLCCYGYTAGGLQTAVFPDTCFSPERQQWFFRQFLPDLASSESTFLCAELLFWGRAKQSSSVDIVLGPVLARRRRCVSSLTHEYNQHCSEIKI